MSQNYINKIKVGNTEYDIQASSIGQLSEINIVNEAESLINFTTGSGASTVTGNISLNSKGNLSVESLSKHVNLEAAMGIQLKPTTNIIIDTTRRLKNGSKHDNEANIEVVYDDYNKDQSSGNLASNDRYGYLKIHSRALDLRCYGHGGIAIQPCGHDSSNKENKIKFESDRKVGANSIADPNTDYLGEGGKGVEFGTFNNEHTSIFSKDYRFNEDGKVYSVTRGTVASDGSKYDYPTQGDDFKDILRTNKDTDAIYSNGNWGVSDPSKEYIMGATWKSIVKTANALNDKDWTDTNISGKGNLQLTVVDEVEWVSATDNGHAVVLAEDKQDPKRKYVDDGNVYKLLDNNYYTCQLKNNGEHHLNLEADSTIKLESGFNDVEITAGDKIQNNSKVIQLEATEKVDFSTTPVISLMARKINKYNAYESSDAKLQITSLNNSGITVYENTVENYVRIPYTTLYTDLGVYEPVIINSEKISVFESDRQTVKPEGAYIVRSGYLNLLMEVDSEGKLGKKAKVCNNSQKPTLYSDSALTEEFNIDPSRDYTSNIPTIYTDSRQMTTGYCIAKDENQVEYIIYLSEGVLTKFAVDNPSNSPLVMGWCLPLSSRLANYNYSDVIFEGVDQIGENETAIANGSPLTVGNMECSINDIITLVNYFKTDGKANGPWASQS